MRSNLDILFKIFDTQGVAVQVFFNLLFMSNMLQDLQVFLSLLWGITRFQSQKLLFCYPTGSSIWREKERKKSLASTRDFSLNVLNVSSLNTAAKQSETALPVSLSLDSLQKGQVSTCSFCKPFFALAFWSAFHLRSSGICSRFSLPVWALCGKFVFKEWVSFVALMAHLANCTVSCHRCLLQASACIA